MAQYPRGALLILVLLDQTPPYPVFRPKPHASRLVATRDLRSQHLEISVAPRDQRALRFVCHLRNQAFARRHHLLRSQGLWIFLGR